MSTTSRSANRVVLGLAGLLTAGAGAAAVATAVPALAGPVSDAARTARAQLQTGVDAVGSPSFHAVAATVGVIALVIALVLVASRGGGRTTVALRDDGGEPSGGVEISADLLSDVLRAALEPHPEVAAVGVSAHEARRGTTWRVRVRTRPGAAPRDVVDLVAEQVALLDSQLGRAVPVLVEITRAAGSSRTPLR